MEETGIGFSPSYCLGILLAPPMPNWNSRNIKLPTKCHRLSFAKADELLVAIA